MKKHDDRSLPKWKTPIGMYCVDGFNTSAVIRKISQEGMAGTYETICRCDGKDWEKNAALIAKLLEENRTKTNQ